MLKCTYRVGPQDSTPNMERTKAAANLAGCAWLLPSFFPFRVSNPAAPPCVLFWNSEHHSVSVSQKQGWGKGSVIHQNLNPSFGTFRCFFRAYFATLRGNKGILSMWFIVNVSGSSKLDINAYCDKLDLSSLTISRSDRPMNERNREAVAISGASQRLCISAQWRRRGENG